MVLRMKATTSMQSRVASRGPQRTGAAAISSACGTDASTIFWMFPWKRSMRR
ncbi:TetR family transcriptional regulator [Dyella tabacisoli]|uniref:TetR family transcriptional regulator n=1 Tax=Dyella tabacisoli TaxID=2282381 RepID=A0A369ULW3_9GAMM|nr:TetR family transcriptional regulator [Dyella tabacisoli]